MTRICLTEFVFCVFHLVNIPEITNGQSREVDHVLFDKIALDQYNNYHNANFFTYRITSTVNSVDWKYYLTKSSDECPPRATHIYLQHGSFPLVIENNKTFPEDFYLHRSELKNRTIYANGTLFSLPIPFPRPGIWFSLAFIEKKDSESVKKLTDKNCNYYIQVNVSSKPLADVFTLEPQMSVHVNISSYQKYLMFKFFVKDSVWKYDVIVSDCSVNGTKLNYCPLKLASRGGNWPNILGNNSYTHNCSSQDNTSCTLSVTGPEINDWHYVLLRSNVRETLTVQLVIVPYECSNSVTNSHFNARHISDGSHLSYLSTRNNLQTVNESLHNISILAGHNVTESHTQQGELNRTVSHTNISEDNGSIINFIPVPQPLLCPAIHKLSRIENPNLINFAVYTVGVDIDDEFNISNGHTPTARFDLSSVKDIGGTLRLIVQLDKRMNLTHQNISVDVCIQRLKIPANGTHLFCRGDSILLNSTKAGKAVVRHFPYPEPGPWFIAMKSTCFSDNFTTEEPCIGGRVIVTFSLSTDRCYNGECENEGTCRVYYADAYALSACTCLANYRGYSCGDDSKAAVPKTQLDYTLLLTISNLFFLPAIILSCYRRYFSEAAVYLSNMFFSAFYHACDQGPFSLYRLCIMPYGVLQFTDFFLSILSFWVTLLAASELALIVRAPLHVLGAILLAMAVYWKAHTLWVNLVPIIVGVTLVLIKWVIFSCRRKQLYPRPKRLLCMLPGGLLAGIGLVIFGFLETDANYPYTHSAWHVCMSTSIIFLLPKRKLKVKEDTASQEACMLELTNNGQSDSLLNPVNSSPNEPHHPHDLIL